MNYIQLNESFEYLRDITNKALIQWGPYHYCTVEALVADGYASLFKVVPVTPIAPPVFDSKTQRCERNGAVFVNGEWQYAWLVSALSENEIAEIAERDAIQARNVAKTQRELAVSQIQVTTTSGKTFDGDETSQTRMARAIIALQATGTPETVWVLADNTPTMATVAELSEALALAGAAQAAIWVI